jgi:hypothetical protein
MALPVGEGSLAVLIVQLWKMVVLLNVMYLEREMIVVLKKVREHWWNYGPFFINTLYHWTIAIDCFHFSSFHDFIDFFSFSS